MTLRLTLGLMLGLASALSCRTAMVAPPVPVESLVATEAQAALWLPDLTAATRQLDALCTGLTSRAGSAAYKNLRQSLTTQLGIDPFNSQALTAIGLRPAGSLLLFVEPGLRLPLLALPVADPVTFHKALGAFFERAEGATKVTSQLLAGRTVVTVGRPFGDTLVPTAHWADFKDYTVITRGDGLAALVAFLERQQRPAETSLATATGYTDDRQALPPGLGYAVLGQAPLTVPPPPARLGAEPSFAARPASPPRLTASLRWDAQGIAVDARLHLLAVAPAAVEASLGGAPVGPLGAWVAHDAIALALTRGLRSHAAGPLSLPAAALARLSRLGWGSALVHPLQQEAQAFAQTELAPHLLGPLAVGLHLHPPQAETGTTALAGRMYNLLQALQLAAIAEVDDPAAVAQLLIQKKARLTAQHIPVRIQQSQIGGKATTLYTVSDPKGTLGWAIFQSYFVVALGEGRLEKTLQALATPPTPPGVLAPDTVGSLWQQQGGSLLLLRSDALATVLETAVPGAMGLQAIIGGIAEVLRTVGDVALGARPEPPQKSTEAQVVGSIVRLELREQLH